ncbi:energy-coupled thiamine transporter ThiT [Hazenella coriacea]|uniref:Thiamine transporter n=1 Tax=Hazenella coriacea TaxID=1179467 RepID=A0A4R3L4M8_9BACL|nr:energy-coupled thiamine transporter ThiT [Hazenella coriacea]TCS93084.1 thiamine transporter [Hazenella coriacea]
MSKQRERIMVMVEIAILTALAVVLHKATPFQWVYGGSISLVMIPIALLAFRRGWIAGVIAGGLTGLLSLLLGGSVYYPLQVVLDYPLAFACLGLAGLIPVRTDLEKASLLKRTFAALFIAGAGRFVAHYLSGVIFFAEFAPKGQSPYIYSLVYNGSYILPEIIITFIVMLPILWGAPHLVQKSRTM